jgi:hypothetical protein
MADLITSARAQYNLNNINLTANETTTLGALVTAVSKAIVKYCRRDFASTAYDELYSGNGQRRLILRQFPIQSIQSVRYRPVTVFKIQNTDTTTNQQARVSVNATGLTLVRVASGVSTTDTSVTFAGNVTLGAMATAVIALGAGWTAQVVGDANDYTKWPSADMYVANSTGEQQGALTCRGAFAELKMHTNELAGFSFAARSGWLLRAIPYTDPELLRPEDLVWSPGINNFRVQYTAGYATIPEDIQEACAIWVAQLFWDTKRDPGLGQAGFTGVTQFTPFSTMPPSVGLLLMPYRDRKWFGPLGA